MFPPCFIFEGHHRLSNIYQQCVSLGCQVSFHIAGPHFFSVHQFLVICIAPLFPRAFTHSLCLETHFYLFLKTQRKVSEKGGITGTTYPAFWWCVHLKFVLGPECHSKHVAIGELDGVGSLCPPLCVLGVKLGQQACKVSPFICRTVSPTPFLSLIFFTTTVNVCVHSCVHVVRETCFMESM